MSEMKVAYAVKDERIMVVNHKFKEYPESSKVGYRVSTTRGWLPKNCEIVNKLLKKGANWAIYHAVEPDIKEIWNKVDSSFKNWAKGMPTVPIRIRENEPFFVQGQEVYLLNGDVYGILEYAIELGMIDLSKLPDFSEKNIHRKKMR